MKHNTHKNSENSAPKANISLEASKVPQNKESLLELIADNTPAFIAYVDVKERYLFTNKVFQQWVGYSKEETYLKSVREIRGERAYKIVRPALRKALDGKPMMYDHIFEKKDGSIIYVNAKYVPHVSEAGKVEGVFILLEDITDRKIAEERMKESEERLKRLISANVIGVVISGMKGEIYEANDVYLDMVGYTRKDLQEGRINWSKITPPEYRKLHNRVHKEILSKGYSTPYEKEYIRKDGGRINVLIGDVLLDKHSRRLLAYVLNISKQKELERRKDEFIALASHELKTPLTSLKMYGELVMRFSKDTLNEKSARLLISMDKQIDKLAELVDDLLDVSRIQSGKLLYKKENFAIDKLLKETIENLQRVSKRHTLVLHGRTGQVVRADRERIRQVITNLITNAVKYSPKADRINIALHKKHDEVMISVQDFGIGIPQNQKNKIFDRFFQVDRPMSQTYPGLGLGLFITKEILDRHKGRIWVESKKKEGTTFYFTLPAGKRSKADKTHKNP